MMGKIYVTADDGGVREGDGEVRSEMHALGDAVENHFPRSD